jgi:dTDP-D-glucose 4,6-dehydratase
MAPPTQTTLTDNSPYHPPKAAGDHLACAVVERDDPGGRYPFGDRNLGAGMRDTIDWHLGDEAWARPLPERALVSEAAQGGRA